LKIPKGGNQNPYIEEEQTKQWPKEKVQKDKHRSTKRTYKTKDRVTRTIAPLTLDDPLDFHLFQVTPISVVNNCKLNTMSCSMYAVRSV
jgi:hypothetical protein